MKMNENDSVHVPNLLIILPPGTPSVLFFLGNFTPKTSNYCLKNMVLGFPGTPKKTENHPGFPGHLLLTFDGWPTSPQSISKKMSTFRGEGKHLNDISLHPPFGKVFNQRGPRGKSCHEAHQFFRFPVIP